MQWGLAGDPVIAAEWMNACSPDDPVVAPFDEVVGGMHVVDAHYSGYAENPAAATATPKPGSSPTEKPPP